MRKIRKIPEENGIFRIPKKREIQEKWKKWWKVISDMKKNIGKNRNFLKIGGVI